MTDLAIYASGVVFLFAAFGCGVAVLKRSFAARDRARLRNHLDWNGGHRASRVAAPRRA